MFLLFYFISSLAATIADGLLLKVAGIAPVTAIYYLAVVIPYLAVFVRRMHDSNHSGWWVLFPGVNLLFTFFDSTPGMNRFGADPKAEERLAMAQRILVAQ